MMAHEDKHICIRYLIILVGLSGVAVLIAIVSRSNIFDSSSDTNTRGSRALDSLKFIVVISRHGNRPGVLTFPNDPYPNNDTKLWPYGRNHDISSYGRIQMFNLGVRIRSLYNGFLDTQYYPENIFAASTAIDRTLVSAQAFLSGLFPPTARQSWNKYIPSQLIPVYSTSPDKSLVVSKCETVANLRKNALEKWEIDNTMKRNSIFELINRQARFNATSIIDFFAVLDALFSEDTEGFSIPNWAKQIYPKHIQDIFNELIIAFTADSDVMVKLTTGQLFKEIIDTMKNKLNRSLSPDRRMFYYSGHDHTLISLQHIFGIPKTSIIGIIKPGSALVFELHKDPSTTSASVQVLYIDAGSPDLSLRSLSTPACGTPCSFQKLSDSTQRFTNISNYEEECKGNYKLR